MGRHVDYWAGFFVFGVTSGFAYFKVVQMGFIHLVVQFFDRGGIWIIQSFNSAVFSLAVENVNCVFTFFIAVGVVSVASVTIVGSLSLLIAIGVVSVADVLVVGILG